jgi:hypothetical protein
MMRLAIFRGGFPRTAAEEVAGATLPILLGVVDKSFLHWDSARGPQPHPRACSRPRVGSPCRLTRWQDDDHSLCLCLFLRVQSLNSVITACGH